MNESSFSSMLRREWKQLFTDPWLCSLITWVPLVLAVMLWSVFAKGVARELPIGLVDLDKSQISRSIARNFDSSPALHIVKSYPDVAQGSRDLRAGNIYGLVVLPEGLEKNTVLGAAPEVTAFVNSQFLLIGKTINSALLQAQSTFTAKVEVKKNLSTGQSALPAALSSALPIGTKVTPLFNVNTNYAQFLISAILPALWQILMVALTVLSFAAEKRRKGLHAWLEGGPVKAIIVKFIPLIIISWVHGFLFLWGMYIALGWPMHGDWSLLVVALFLTSCASVAVSSLFFLLTRDAARGLSLAAAYAAPGLAFMGVTFPVSDMTLPARIWRSLIPVSHYIEIQFSQVNYGASLTSVLPQFRALALFGILFFVAVVLIKVIAGREQVIGETV
jgi:ABC-2 type transport system permease protein